MNSFNAYIALALLLTIVPHDAFIVNNHQRITQMRQSTAPMNSRLHMSSTDDKVAQLRAAAQKARDEAKKLADDLGKDIDLSSSYSKAQQIKENEKNKVTLGAKSYTASEVQSFLKPLDFTSSTASEQISTLDSLIESGNLVLWNAAKTTNANTATPLPLRPYPVNLAALEQKTGGKITAKSLGVDGEDDVSLDDFKYATIGVTLGASVLGVGSLALIPGDLGPTLCYFFALLPILWVAVGSSAPGILAGLISVVRTGGEDGDEKEDRICRHEAAHFLCGYLSGLPVRSYKTGDAGEFPCVEFHVSKDGEASGRELTPEEIAVMSVVAMSGSVAEAMTFDEAKGGGNDLLELNGIFKRSEEFLGATKQQDLTRWGALAAYNLLNGNKDAYEKLVMAFKGKKSVAECIAVIESV